MDVPLKDTAATQRKVTSDAESQLLVLQESYRKLGMNPEDARIVCCSPTSRKSHGREGSPPSSPFLSSDPCLALPFLSFIILVPFTTSQTVEFAEARVVSAWALSFLGLAKAKIAGQKYALSALITLSNGDVAAVTADLIWWVLRNVAGLQA